MGSFSSADSKRFENSFKSLSCIMGFAPRASRRYYLFHDDDHPQPAKLVVFRVAILPEDDRQQPLIAINLDWHEIDFCICRKKPTHRTSKLFERWMSRASSVCRRVLFFVLFFCCWWSRVYVLINRHDHARNRVRVKRLRRPKRAEK